MGDSSNHKLIRFEGGEMSDRILRGDMLIVRVIDPRDQLVLPKLGGLKPVAASRVIKGVINFD